MIPSGFELFLLISGRCYPLNSFLMFLIFSSFFQPLLVFSSCVNLFTTTWLKLASNRNCASDFGGLVKESEISYH